MPTMSLEVIENVPLATVILATGIMASLLSWLWPFLRAPGPWGIPILGYYPFLRNDFYIHLHELAKKHGEVYIINLAGRYFVYLDTLKAIREAHVNQSDIFDGRNQKYSFVEIGMENGLAFLKGEPWKIHRKFSVRSMREVGLNPNKEVLKNHVQQAILDTLGELQKSEGNPINVTTLLFKVCPFVITSIIFGTNITQEERKALNEGYIKRIAPMKDKNILLSGPIAKHFIFPRVPGYSDLCQSMKTMSSLVSNIVADRKKNLNPHVEPETYIDAFLREKILLEEKKDPRAIYFTEQALVPNIILMYGEGVTGVVLFLASSLRALSLLPDVQDAVHEEIISVVGAERLPTWEDRINLPLTYSTLKELTRTSMSLPAYADLECVRDTTILGVKVPKGCTTIVNIWAVHNDPNLYENPECFDATRFLPDKPKVEQPILFGVGKRMCTGENLVMSEVFLFLAAILQNFSLLPENDDFNGCANDNSDHDDTMNVNLRVIPRSG